MAAIRILTIIDEASRECLALIVARKLRHEDVLAALADLFVSRPAGAYQVGQWTRVHRYCRAGIGLAGSA